MLSATCVTMNGISLFVAPDAVWKGSLISADVSPALNQFIGACMLGWGVGKWSAVLTGSEAAVTAFATFNLFPMGMLVLASMKMPWLAMFFTLGYLRIVATGPRVPAASTDWPAGFYFLSLSAFLVSCDGIVFLYEPGFALKFLGMTPPGPEVMNVAGIACLGWGVGKATSVYNGDAAISIFIKVNLIAMIVMIAVCYIHHLQPAALIASSVFAIIYAILAATGPKTAARESKEPLLTCEHLPA